MIKQMAGRIVTRIAPQCCFHRAVFVLGHMRCGSTALSNILCSRPDISGYGEAHISYKDRSALGVLAINQLRRKAWRPRAQYLFDKVLHSRYDDDPVPEFFEARAIFLVREPFATICSIRKLFQAIGSAEYVTDSLAADYYEQRLAQLLVNWSQFPADHRIGLSFDQLTSDPDAALAAISSRLRLTPPLANRYDVSIKADKPGAGDPLSAHRFSSIVSGDRSTSLTGKSRILDIPSSRLAQLDQLYFSLRETVTKL